MVKKLTHEDLMRETSEQRSLRMKAAKEVIKDVGWYEAGGIGFYFHPNSCYWMDLNTGVISIFNKNRKDIGIDSDADAYAYTGEDALGWVQEHDNNMSGIL
jgi:metal-dependent amidase/aminoacylase/carboxypeptidase family protein